MDVELIRKNLAEALKPTLKAAAKDSKAASVILTHLLISAAENRVIVTGSNLETTVRAFLGARVKAPGQVALKGVDLNDLVNTLTGPEITLKLLKGNTVDIRSAKDEVKLKGMPGDDFPRIAPISLDGACQIKAGPFRAMARAALRCVATDDARPILTGVLLEWLKGGKFDMAGADGFRLGLARLATAFPESWAGRHIIVPARSLAQVADAIQDDGVPIQIQIADGQFQVALPHLEFSSQTLHGQYPDFRPLIPRPEAATTVATLQVADLLKAIKLTTVMAANKVGRATFKPGDPGEMGLMAEDKDRGRADATADATVIGPPLRVGLNLGYTKDVLDGMTEVGAKLCEVRMQDPRAAVGFCPVGLANDQAQVRYVVMPVHLDGPTKAPQAKETPAEGAREEHGPGVAVEPEIASVEA